MKRTISQMNPNDNQVVQCYDRYVMTSPWHDTEGRIVISITFRISGETNDTDSILVSISPYLRPRNPKHDKSIYIELTRDLESDYDVTISVTCRIYSNTNDTISILVSILHIRGWGTRKWWDYLCRTSVYLESDYDVTISVTCRISSNTDATDSILVSILLYSRLRNSKMMRLFM